MFACNRRIGWTPCLWKWTSEMEGKVGAFPGGKGADGKEPVRLRKGDRCVYKELDGLCLASMP